ELHAFEGLSYADLAMRVGISVSTVGTRLLRARRRLRAALDSLWEGAPSAQGGQRFTEDAGQTHVDLTPYHAYDRLEIPRIQVVAFVEKSAQISHQGFTR